MTVGRIFTKIYIFISLSWAFFRKPEKLGSHTGSKWRTVKNDPNDPLTRWPNDPVPCLADTHSGAVQYIVQVSVLVSDGAAEGRTHDGARDVSQYVTDDVTPWRRACAVCVRARVVGGRATHAAPNSAATVWCKRKFICSNCNKLQRIIISHQLFLTVWQIWQTVHNCSLFHNVTTKMEKWTTEPVIVKLPYMPMFK